MVLLAQLATENPTAQEVITTDDNQTLVRLAATWRLETAIAIETEQEELADTLAAKERMR